MALAVRKPEEVARVARSLKVLGPLIQENIQKGREAAERAGMPYYQEAGALMIEARLNFSDKEIKAGAFNAWIYRTLGIKKDQARIYMSYATAISDGTTSAIVAPSLSAFVRETSNSNYNRPSSWHEPVQQVINRVDTETLNLKRDELKRADEREAQRVLALQLIDIGYKVLARTLHPDKKDGSREAMSRLNAVRDRLKQHA